jgi:chromosome segregation and condensation protein ScpB
MRRKTVEAALFLASGPLSITDLMTIAECSAGELEDEMSVLRVKYDTESGIKLLEAHSSYQLIVNPDVIHKVKQLSPYRDLSPGLVKALSVIAFKGPLKQSILVNTIGNRVYEYIGELEKRGLITAKREGRTRILRVTKLFVDYFGQSVPENNLERFLEEKGDKPPPVAKKGRKGAEKKRSKYFHDYANVDDNQLIEEQEMLEDAEEVKGEEERGIRDTVDTPDEVEEK